MESAVTDTIYWVAGEPSGDLLTAPLVSALSKRIPGLQHQGIGGERMAAAGVKLHHDLRHFSVMGLVEVLKRGPKLLSLLGQVTRRIAELQPRLVILTDFPGFNLPLAKRLHRAGLRVIYFVSPKFWAWRAGRVKTLAASCRETLTIFPFEPELIRAAGGRAFYTGHPLVDLVQSKLEPPAFRELLGLKPGEKLVTFFPGSRFQEVSALLPSVIKSISLLQQRLNFPWRAAVHFADSALRRRFLPLLAQTNLLAPEIASWEAMKHSDLAVVASGTANLETALLGTPQIMFYRLHPLSWWLARRVVQLEWASPVNIVLGREAIPELLQTHLSENLAENISAFFHHEQQQREHYAGAYSELRNLLGTPGVYKRLAAHLAEDW